MSSVHIAALRAVPNLDRRRVHIAVEVVGSGDPPPYLELLILDPGSQVVGEMLIMGCLLYTSPSPRDS